MSNHRGPKSLRNINIKSGYMIVSMSLLSLGFVYAFMFFFLHFTNPNMHNTNFEDAIKYFYFSSSHSSLLFKPWIIFTYFIFDIGFLRLFSSLIWIFLFGDILETLIGNRITIKLFLRGGVISGLLILLLSLIFNVDVFAIGPKFGIMAIAGALISLTPKSKWYLSEHLSIPIAVPVAIFSVLSSIDVQLLNHWIAFLGLVISFGYGWYYIYKIKQIGTTQKSTSNDISTQVELDKILDKINAKGIQSLTQEEHFFLNQLGQS